jgi:hypothetical protein
MLRNRQFECAPQDGQSTQFGVLIGVIFLIVIEHSIPNLRTDLNTKRSYTRRSTQPAAKAPLDLTKCLGGLVSQQHVSF